MEAGEKPKASIFQSSTEDLAQGTVWDLSLLYADNAAWENERASIESSLPELAKLAWNFMSSGCFDRMQVTACFFARAAWFASTQDDRNTDRAGRKSRSGAFKR